MRRSAAEYFLIISVLAWIGLSGGAATAQESGLLDLNQTRNPTADSPFPTFPISTNQNCTGRSVEGVTTPFGGVVDCACDSLWASGVRVEAAVDNPSGASGIMAGALGTVICGTTLSPPLLISWDNWTMGHDGNGYCECPVYSVPNNSAWYVDCSEVIPAPAEPLCVCGGDYWVGSRVRATVNNPQGAPGISIGDEGTVVCGDSIDPLPVLISWDEWSSGHNGNDYCECPAANPPNEMDSGWWVECNDAELSSEVSCVCGGTFEKGDRVRALVENPSGATGISVGHLGTVTCGTTLDGGFPLISWDNWTMGHDGNGFCDCPVTDLPNTSGWYVLCEEVAKEYVSIFSDGFEFGNTSAWSATVP